MKFVIVGYGRVGTRTARVLHEEGHEVVVLDRDPGAVERAREEGFEAYQGDATDDRAFDDVDFSTVDAVGGLTSDVNANFAACTVGNYHGCRTVLRIDEDYRKDIYDKYAGEVDEVIYPERLGAAGAKTALLGGDFNVIADLTEDLQLTTINVPESSPAVGRRLSEVEVPDDARIYAHGRTGESMTIPIPGTEIEAGDQVAILAERDAIEGVRAVLIGDAAA
ncbi:potassium transporter Trk [Halobacteriales archaeon QS_1_68_20]|nr:MAG: potassium transporter Trk [Halobacteriales archaeon QS_1_68_20]